MSDAAYLHRKKMFQRQALLDNIQTDVDADVSDEDIITKFGERAKEYDIEIKTFIARLRQARIASTATKVSIGVTPVYQGGVPVKGSK